MKKVLMIGPANLGPYHFARFRETSKLLPEFTYVGISTKERYRPWSSDLGNAPFRIVNHNKGASIPKMLEAEHPDIVISIGYNSWVLLSASCWAKRRNLPNILQCDSTYIDHPRVWWKEVVKGLIVRRLFDAAFVSGARSGHYIESLGIERDGIWYGVDVVDNAHFNACKKTCSLPRAFPKDYFLAVARLSPEKNISRLLLAFELYRKERGEWGLVIAGTGPEETALKGRTPKGLRGLIHWHGWANYDDLPSLYHQSSCFILPSIKESWGLVVNEAMASGLPILISQNCGCVEDLCHSGINGYDFDPLNIEQLSELMLKMSSEQIDRVAMGKASQAIISKYTPEIWAETVLDMTETLLSHK